MTKRIAYISTKTGDKGETSLASGERVAKSSSQIELIGELDELNSWLGLVVAQLKASQLKVEFHIDLLMEMQNTLFYVGAMVADSPVKFPQEQLTKIEQAAKDVQDLLADNWHHQFLLPGGTVLGAQIDIARTVCRRAERRAVAFSLEHAMDEVNLKCLNRLSDYLYVLRCLVNQQLSYSEKKFIVK